MWYNSFTWRAAAPAVGSLVKLVPAAQQRCERFTGGDFMADILAFDRYAGEPDPEGMSGEELREYLDAVEARLRALDEEEPADMESELKLPLHDRRTSITEIGGTMLTIRALHVGNERENDKVGH